MDNPAYVIDFEKTSDTLKNSKKSEQLQQEAYTFEDAITLTGIGKFHYLLLLVCGLCFMSVMVEIMGVGLIMPSMKCDLESTVSEQGMLASAGFLGVVLSSHAMGFLADTWGRVRTLRYALILSAISTIISSFSVNILMLTVFRFLTGFFISGGQACVFSLCGEFHGNKTRVRYVTLLSGFLPLALIYLPFMSSIILPLQIDTTVLGMKFSSWRILLMVNSALSIIAVVGLYTIPETPKYILVQGDHDGALEVLRTIFERNTGRPRSHYAVKNIILETGGASLTDIHGFKDAVKMIWNQTIPLFYKERYLHTINICLIMFVVYGISQGLFMWFPTILNEMISKDGLGLTTCYIITNMELTTNLSTDICAGEVDTFMFNVLMVIGAAFTVFFLIFAYTIDYVGKKNLLICWLIVSGICMTVIHWITVFYISVFAITLIMAVGNCGGLVSTIAMEFFPTNINAMGMCFIMMIGRLGAVVGANIMGQIIFNYCDLVFWVFLGIVCILCFMGLVLPERKTDKKSVMK
ncbi:synaptic vesicle glycoprotein 2B [Teleopsis dalmanni]|uniref:synaptic vesicle glycoprotein 2B n=1 Tax=Teleopsis dalmanni TaxID=139649 RepID=UPI0018CE6C2F|nr:synaptic vesicle glycoprotein 2B [Teleopsis dalmanni]